jgi:hypothetical protein
VMRFSAATKCGSPQKESVSRGLAMACRTPLTTEQRRQTAQPEIGAYVPPNFLLRTNR